MTDTLLDRWTYLASDDGEAVVVPDGCRDLICRVEPGQAPRWFVTTLDDAVFYSQMRAGVYMEGFRMKPGTVIDVAGILRAAGCSEPDSLDVYGLLGDFTAADSDIETALNCLGSSVSSIEQAAGELGVSTRTLQRLVMKKTGRSPLFWFRLARVRRAARDLSSGAALADIAVSHNYSDQAHMTRDVKRWFSVTPAQMQKGCHQRRLLDEPGYF